MKIFAILFFLSTGVYAQDSVSVLFIGNSYTYYNTLPTLVSDLAASLGDEVTYDSHAPGGTTFANHAVNPVVYTKINSQPWDFVVLQAQSQEPSFPDGQVNTNTLPYAMQLADSIYANNFCSEALFFMTWGRENGDPQWGPISTFDGMNARLRSAYMRFADSTEGAVAPVGSAWKYVRDNHPTINLYAGDGSHPSYEGSYLAACTFYASVFRKSPVGAPFIGSLDPLTAGKLQTAAALTVLDSLEQWNLRPISEHTQADFTASVSSATVTLSNLSTKAQSYFWDFGDGTTSTDESPVHVYGSGGFHTVSLIATSECDSDTLMMDVELTAVIGVTELTDGWKIASKGEGKFDVFMPQAIDEVVVLDVQGKSIDAHIRVEGNNANVDLQACSTGMYFICIKSEYGVQRISVMR